MGRPLRNCRPANPDKCRELSPIKVAMALRKAEYETEAPEGSGSALRAWAVWLVAVKCMPPCVYRAKRPSAY